MDSGSFLKGVVVGVIGCVYPVVLAVIFLGSVVLFLTGYWGAFWWRLQGSQAFRPANSKEMKRLVGQLALVDNAPVARMADSLKDATVGVSEYRGANGPLKLFAVAFHGSDTLQVFFRENADEKLELTGWAAANAEKR